MNDEMLQVLRHIARHFDDPGVHRLDTPFEVAGLEFKTQVAKALTRLATASPPFINGITASGVDYPIVITGLTERGWEAVEAAPDARNASPGMPASVPVSTAVANGGAQFQVALSFAGEQRVYVQRVSAELARRGIQCFYDEEQRIALWGKNQLEELQRVYMDASNVVVMFISSDYAAKAWPKHERRSALSRAIHERREYVLPVRFDETVLPGLDPDVSYLSASEFTPEEIAEAITSKLVALGVTVPDSPVVAAGWARAVAGRGSANMIVKVLDDAGRPARGAHVLAVAGNGVYVSAQTDEQGLADLSLPTRRTVTVFAAHPELLPALITDHDPINDSEIILPHLAGAGSVIFERGTGEIPGLSGRLNPIRDNADRYVLYADNISIEDDPHQPRHFTPGEPMRLEDAEGERAVITVISIIGRSTLLRFES